MKLKDKVAIVTGAAQGIGREYALRFVEEGAAVGLVDTRFEQAKAVEREITAKNGKALAIAADVTNEAELASMAKQVAERFGRIDALINNAAIYYDLELGRASLEYGRKVMDVNVFGVMMASWARISVHGKTAKRFDHQHRVNRRMAGCHYSSRNSKHPRWGHYGWRPLRNFQGCRGLHNTSDGAEFR
jgi:NAD(P)-dependent dehydrogenase (short-subunit alcohol dehydrogenase family)